MDVTTLHTLNEDLAGFLSEVTVGDLSLPVHPGPGDLGDLYLHLIAQSTEATAALVGATTPRRGWPESRDRAALGAAPDTYGDCGLAAGHRQTARRLECAFTSAGARARLYAVTGHPVLIDLATLYQCQVGTTITHTHQVARALGLTYHPPPGLAVVPEETDARA